MHFGNPQALWFLALWPLLVWLGWRALARRRQLAGQMGQTDVIAKLYPASVAIWRRRRLMFMLAGILLTMLAAARPQYGRIEQTVQTKGTNVLIALDCSPSMDARDVLPSRIERAKKSFGMLLRSLQGNRVGIIAFAGAAFLQCPMTLDQAMASEILESLDTESVGLAGTDLGAAIDTATEAFAHGADDGDRALVLITDGEDNEGRALEAAKRAAEANIKIYAVGIGTNRGTVLAQQDGGFKEDSQGIKVNTRLQMDTLNKIARATGGGAWEAGSSPNAAVTQITYQIQQQQKIEFEARKQVIYQDRFQWFLWPALLLLTLGLVLRPAQPQLVGAKS